MRDFEQQLLTWTGTINLISKHTYRDIWRRHILDSAQLSALIDIEPRTWIDLGSGGGLPGIVTAILAKERWPTTTVHLVESDSRKAAFLKLMVVRYNLSAHIVQNRAERLAPMNASVLSARAFAPLEVLVGFAHRLLVPDGVAVFPKGRTHREEIDTARRRWRFKSIEKPSIIDPESRILLISEIEAGKGSL